MVLGRIYKCGMGIETYTALDSTVMAIHQWRFLLIEHFGYNTSKHEAFCRVLGLDGFDTWTPDQWLTVLYSTIARFTGNLVPAMIADPHLTSFEAHTLVVSGHALEPLIEEILLHNLPGRCFMISDTGLLCLGAGPADGGDLICVLLGCSTPLILRECKGYYTYIGDAFVDGYMYGKAIDELNDGARELQTFELR
jgi:hypothetical protein